MNYERELDGQPLLAVSLNRLFLGNPGTGKATTAAIYGRILKGLGMLSDGAVELKQPSDCGLRRRRGVRKDRGAHRNAAGRFSSSTKPMA